jgi:hypothetical protein
MIAGDGKHDTLANQNLKRYSFVSVANQTENVLH